MKSKLCIILFFFLNSICFSQQTNPDGDRVSLHITPYYNFGSITNNLDHKSTNSRGWGAYNFNVSDNNVYDYSLGFSFLVILKIPMSSKITISPFFQSETWSYNYSNVETFTAYNQSGNSTFVTDTKDYEIMDSRLKAGATLSIYF